eukprot:SAG22_NODE_380_length_11402_cov_8.514154_14_plen_170_part_00
MRPRARLDGHLDLAPPSRARFDSHVAEPSSYVCRQLVVAHDPELGIYCFRFFRDGEWHPVFVDDYIARDMKGDPIGASSERAGWISLYEKAYAKFHGGYGAISGGHFKEAMTDLTVRMRVLGAASHSPVHMLCFGPASWFSCSACLVHRLVVPVPRVLLTRRRCHRSNA